MDILIQQVLNGLSIASVITLIAVGVTLIFGLTGIINFAHGEFLMVGSIVTWIAVQQGIPFLPAMLIAILVVAVMGFALERGLFQFTLTRPTNGFIVSLGLIIVLQHVVILFFGPNQKSIPRPLSGVWDVSGVRIASVRVMVILVTIAVVAMTFVMITRSRYGRALRAAVEDRDTAALMGIPVRRYITGVFVLGSALAGLGGALLIALFPVTPFTGGTMVMKGFAVALMGGLGNLTGAVVAGLILGIVEGFSAGYGFSEWTDAYSFGLMILVLLIKPNGLFGGTSGPKMA
ncbi:branched-chain amino acid ABC transporter permease [Kaistia dalseonensis]|uniref:Branched-chain amino acid transport system permease protein n=1 Tax=Kaistia dalseonensis TaxID=410840 RepID=A0ABU0H5D3_9HYPH|nr:branched-chain amino acid ABC transporter permease [Kaistia dalseonensis]MCX5494504.1 branched-chain amino acid ABC transporter permease [Kaistia dalseonensis]MDQ0437083.1 branched-chain amino acid transport system permease protein [Kaistia dalseonensis]